METGSKVNILLVDDNSANLLALEATLESLNQNLVSETSGEAALAQVYKEDFAVILLDVHMPGMDGFQTASLIRQNKRSRYTPIIFLSTIHSTEDVLTGYSFGAADYLFKPVMPEILRAKVAVFIDLFKKNEELKYQKRLTMLTGASGKLLNSVKMSELLPAILDLSCKLIDADAHALWFFSSSSNSWKIVSASGLSEDYKHVAIQTMSLDNIQDSPIATDLVDNSEGFHSLISAPLSINGQKSGTIIFYYLEPHHFNEMEIRIASALSNLSATAIEMVKLYEG
jgi:CheY-like chemotaxis protein